MCVRECVCVCVCGERECVCVCVIKREKMTMRTEAEGNFSNIIFKW